MGEAIYVKQGVAGERRTKRRQGGRFSSAFRKVGDYVLNPATEPRHTALHLSPALKDTQTTVVVKSFNGQADSYDETERELIRKKLIALHQAGLLAPNTMSVSPTAAASSERSSTSTASGPGIFRDIVRHQYAADNIHQSYDVLIPPREPSASNFHKPCWLVWIHGGYFRSINTDSTSVRPAITLIEESDPPSPAKARISGYASLNYRLAAHTAHPQDPATEQPYTLRNAKWPDQPNDILAALKHLQSKYPESEDYILAGHSVGATLAFVAALKCQEANIRPPKAVLGVNGIYDFPEIHSTNPGYVSMTRNAIDDRFWREASPACFDINQYSQNWPAQSGNSRRFVLLAHSKDDGLVPYEQMTRMAQVFKDDNGNDDPGFEVDELELFGEHDQIWSKSHELARTFEKATGIIQGS